MNQMYASSAHQLKANQAVPTEKQPVLAILSTQQDNNYPMYLKARMISNERGETLKENVEKKLHFIARQNFKY